MSTFFAKTEENREKKWRLVDAKGEVLGRLASRISRMLSGKDKPEYTPHADTGMGVVVVNARDIRVTGRKVKNKI